MLAGIAAWTAGWRVGGFAGWAAGWGADWGVMAFFLAGYLLCGIVGALAATGSVAVIGVGQWLILRKQVRESGSWVLASALVTAVAVLVAVFGGWAVAKASNLAEDVVVTALIGGGGGLLYGLITGPVLALLLRHPIQEGNEADA